jgi:hypothetical protein
MMASTFLRPRALGLFQGEPRQRLCIHGLPSRCDTGVARQIDTCNTGYSDYLFLVGLCGIQAWRWDVNVRTMGIRLQMTKRIGISKPSTAKLQLRMTVEEHVAAVELAKYLHMSLSDLVRKLISDKRKQLNEEGHRPPLKPRGNGQRAVSKT